jgi:hypothetical protein
VDLEYGSSWGGWSSNEVHGPYRVSLMRDWGEFFSHTKFVVVMAPRFWHNEWCGNQILKIAFPKLFTIAQFKDASVVDHLEFSSDSLEEH